jgi:hypothetical protein
MKNFLAIISIIIGINSSFAQTNKPMLINSFPYHITNFTSLTKDSISIKYKRIYNFTDFVEIKSYKLLKQKETLLDSTWINYMSAHYTFEGVLSDTSFTYRSFTSVKATGLDLGKYADKPEIVYNIKRDKKKNLTYVYVIFIF